MSDTRIELFSFNSTKDTASKISQVVNEFLKRPDIIVEPQDVIVDADETTIVSIVYKIKKKLRKSKSKTK